MGDAGGKWETSLRISSSTNHPLHTSAYVEWSKISVYIYIRRGNSISNVIFLFPGTRVSDLIGGGLIGLEGYGRAFWVVKLRYIIGE